MVAITIISIIATALIYITLIFWSVIVGIIAALLNFVLDHFWFCIIIITLFIILLCLI